MGLTFVAAGVAIENLRVARREEINRRLMDAPAMLASVAFGFLNDQQLDDLDEGIEFALLGAAGRKPNDDERLVLEGFREAVATMRTAPIRR